MKMPGFTAEIAMNKTMDSAKMMAEQNVEDKGHAIRPQFQGAVRHRFCYLICVDGYCWRECY